MIRVSTIRTKDCKRNKLDARCFHHNVFTKIQYLHSTILQTNKQKKFGKFTIVRVSSRGIKNNARIKE